MPSSRREIQGPRPQPLKVGHGSWKVKKSKPADIPAAPSRSPPPGCRPPVISYVHSPKIIHTKPQDFRALVQQLTGKPSPSPPPSSSPPRSAVSLGSAPTVSAEFSEGFEGESVGDTGRSRGFGAGGDPLLLTLGNSPMASVPSPISPGFFLFSPSTNAYLQELSSQF